MQKIFDKLAAQTLGPRVLGLASPRARAAPLATLPLPWSHGPTLIMGTKSRAREEEKRRKSSGSKCSGPNLIAGVLWALVALSFLYVVSQMYGRKGARRGEASVKGGSRAAAAAGGDDAGEEAAAPAPAVVGRPLRSINSKLGSHASLSKNKLLDLEVITWKDIQGATEEELLQVIALWMFADVDEKACDVG